MSDLERIDPAAIPDIYRTLGIVPTRNVYAYSTSERVLLIDRPDGECLCCLLGVLASRAESFKAISSIQHYHRNMADIAGLDPEYAAGLDDGWEDQSLV